MNDKAAANKSKQRQHLGFTRTSETEEIKPSVNGFAMMPSEAEMSKLEQTTESIARLGGGIDKTATALNALLGGSTQSQAPTPVIAASVKPPIAIGKTEEVALSELLENPYNARRTTNQSKLEELAASLKAHGQQTSAPAFYNDEGKLCLIDGQRRLAAAKLVGLPTLRIEIRPKPTNAKELYLASRRANVDREDQSPLDDALAWSLLLQEGVYAEQKELAADIGVDGGIVSKTLALVALPKPCINILAEKPSMLTLRMLDPIRKHFEFQMETASSDSADTETIRAIAEASTEQFILDIVKHEWSAREVEKKVIQLREPKQQRQRSQTPWKETFAGGAVAMKPMPLKNAITLEITALTDPEKAAKLEERLKQVVAEVLN